MIVLCFTENSDTSESKYRIQKKNSMRDSSKITQTTLLIDRFMVVLTIENK